MDRSDMIEWTEDVRNGRNVYLSRSSTIRDEPHSTSTLSPGSGKIFFPLQPQKISLLSHFCRSSLTLSPFRSRRDGGSVSPHLWCGFHAPLLLHSGCWGCRWGCWGRPVVKWGEEERDLWTSAEATWLHLSLRINGGIRNYHIKAPRGAESSQLEV